MGRAADMAVRLVEEQGIAVILVEEVRSTQRGFADCEQRLDGTRY
jgi:hypothetical protein